jgi:hypothetical protein
MMSLVLSTHTNLGLQYIRARIVLEEEYKSNFSDVKKDLRPPKFDTPRCRWIKSSTISEDDLPPIKARILRHDGSASKARGSIIYRDMVHEDILNDPTIQHWCQRLYEPKQIDPTKSHLDDLLELPENADLKKKVLKRERTIHRKIDKGSLTRDRQEWFDKLKAEPGLDRHKGLDAAKVACQKGYDVRFGFEEGARTYSTVETSGQIRRSAIASSSAISFAPPNFL